MVRPARSLPNPETALLPPFFIMLGLLTLLVVAGHSLMKPAVLRNPGLAAYRPPTVAIRDLGRGEGSLEAELAARRVAEAENAKLRPALLAQARPITGPDRLAGTAPQQKTARIERRKDTSWPSAPRLAQTEPTSFAQRWNGSF